MKILAKTGNEDIAVVYIAELNKGKLIEFAESVQPPIPRDKKWVLIISTLYGCPVGCRFCDAGEFYHGKLSKDDMLSQIRFLINTRYPDNIIPAEKFKVQFARMGDPAFNPQVIDVLECLPDEINAPGIMPSVSSIAPNGTDGFFEKLITIKNNIYKERFQLQFSIHTTDTEKRDWLIPVKKWDFKKIALYGERFFSSGDRKITLNFALAENTPLDPAVLLDYFNPEKFIIKITPVNPTFRADKNEIVSHINPEKENYEVIEDLKKCGYDVLLSVGELEENNIGSNCGQHISNYLKEETEIKNSYTYPVNEIKKSGSFDYLYSEAGEKDYISVK